MALRLAARPASRATQAVPIRASLATAGRRAALAATTAAVCCAVAALGARRALGGGRAAPPPPPQPQPQPAQRAAAAGAAGAGMQGISRLFGGGAAGAPAGPAASGQDRLVNYLIASDLVKTPRVEAALRAVDRKKFIDPAYAAPAEAYQDTPLPIGYAQTISAPHMHAICLELLEKHLQPGARALDVGSGSGYLAAAMALMVTPDGSVLGVEKVPELAVRSVDSVRQSNPGLLPPGAAAGEGRRRRPRREGEAAPLLEIVHGNVLSDMLAAEAPFDAIHVGAAADELHAALVQALAPGGRMVIPLGPRYSSQVLTVVDKGPDGAVTRRELMHVGYVPLTRPSEMEDGYARFS